MGLQELINKLLGRSERSAPSMDEMAEPSDPAAQEDVAEDAVDASEDAADEAAEDADEDADASDSDDEEE